MLRIIAGRLKGRRLHTPKGNTARPSAGRLRGALFSILGEQLGPLRVLDLFAGSGALGLEALSRGAQFAVFVEKDLCVAAALQRNLSLAPSATQLLRGDALAALRGPLRHLGPFDLVFLDPPYQTGLIAAALRGLLAAPLLAPQATLICEHPALQPPAPIPAAMAITKTRVMGNSALTLLSYPSNAEPNPEES